MARIAQETGDVEVSGGSLTAPLNPNGRPGAGGNPPEILTGTASDDNEIDEPPKSVPRRDSGPPQRRDSGPPQRRDSGVLRQTAEIYA